MNWENTGIQSIVYGKPLEGSKSEGAMNDSQGFLWPQRGDQTVSGGQEGDLKIG